MTESTTMEHDHQKQQQEEPDVMQPQRQSVDLAFMTPEQRERLYKQAFAGDMVPLHSMALPEECREYPDLRDEILDAYLTHTTFAFNVWVNYDAVAQKFYTDPRAADCGEIRLTPKDAAYLTTIGADRAELSRIRLDISTPFRALCQVYIHVKHAQLNASMNVTTRIVEIDQGQPDLMDYVEAVCEYIENEGLKHGTEGFALPDLLEYAACFCRQADAAGRFRFKVGYGRSWSDRYAGDWMIDKGDEIYGRRTRPRWG